MRPDHLNPLFAGVDTVKGIGAKTAGAISKLLGGAPSAPARLVDVLCHMPSGVIDRRFQPPLSQAPAGVVVTLKVRVIEHRTPPRGRGRVPYRVWCEDDTGGLTLVFFNAHTDYLAKRLPIGETRYVSGRLEDFGGEIQMVHPDHIVDEAGFAELPMVETVYPLGAGVTAASIRKAVTEALSRIPPLGEWIEPTLLRHMAWPDFRAAMVSIHVPADVGDATPDAPGWRRLAYDELLSGQLAINLVRRRLKVDGVAHQIGTATGERIEHALPFALTGAQRRSVSEICGDLAAPRRMLRLLQGDVGSGKTVVALLAMAAMKDAGRQSALMVPTELLARQHLATLTRLGEPAGLRVELLTGRERGKPRDAILERLANHEIDILIGTHALFQSGVDFARLGLAVIDEQHRFGVHQRLALAQKASDPVDVLIMTATPIPRTLVLAYYGDTDVSKLDEKPPGRTPVETRLVPQDRVAEVAERLRSHAESGGQAYWVCPLVEDADEVPATSAQSRYDALKPLLGDRVGLIHGRMSGTEKDREMARFQSGDLAVLVSTTVIEVGVDVPNATIMVIENAERFGLAQLHQLRGRVGRGDKRSACVLVYKHPLSETASARLKTMRETEDGFLIAEEDLRLRGGGEILGTRQSGAGTSRIARPELHGQLLETAHKDAALLLETDPMLQTERGKAARTLLYLFGRDEAVRLIDAG